MPIPACVHRQPCCGAAAGGGRSRGARPGPTTPPPPPRRAGRRPPPAVTERPKLEYFNGIGGFAEDGREYVTILDEHPATPAPWINVVANPAFGFQVAAEGSGYSWSLNSRENQLTPWSNDPVRDRPGEAFYLRDRES